jgi:cell wall-associated NlpC family hydrolase
MLVSAVAVALCLVAVPLQPAAAATTEAGTITAFAEAQLGKGYKWAATGLRRYDCSGLVYRTFYEKGLLDRIGNKRRTARGYFRWFRDNGLLTSNPQPGDLVAWGRPVSHIGIFVGYDSTGKALAISSLTSGVSRHRVDRIGLPLKAYLSVNMER